MGVYKRFNGKRLNPKDKNWSKGTWYVWKRLKGRVIHEPIPEASTQRMAEEAERVLIQRAFNKRYGVQDNDTTFAKFADTTYRRYATQKNTNLKAKETDIDYLTAFFGKKKPISEITAQDCRDAQDQLLHTPTVRAGKRSPSSVNRTMSTLSKIFTLACEEGILERNPMQYVRRLAEPPPRQRLLTPEQKEAFWNEIAKDKYMFRIVMLGVNLPLRRGQILAITREAVDLENRTLFVIKSKGRPPRAVPLNNAALRILSEMCGEVSTGPLITWRGLPVTDFRSRWEKLLVRAGINRGPEGDRPPTREDNFHFHDLRTEFASELLRNNVNPEIVRRLFAHSSMQITQNYLQTDAADLFDAVNSIGDNIQNSEVIQ